MMRIRHFQVERFGLLAGQQAEDLSPGLNVFLGDNEAGKSTCRDFLRAMFFGYKRGGRNDLDYGPALPGTGMPKAGGSGPGGQAAVHSGGGLLLEIDGQGAALSPASQIRLVRRPGKHGGDLLLYDAQGRELPPSLWQGLLSGVTADLYDKVFAFDLQDLASLASLAGPQVSAALHGAAFGTGFRSPAEVLQSLEKGRKELFSPSPTAKTQAINKILQRLRDIQRKIRENGSDLERHALLAREEEELQARLEEQRAEQEALERARARNGSLLAAWELWAELQRLEGELELRPHPGGDFGPDSLTRLETLCTERSEKLAALEARQEELAALEKQLHAERPPRDLARLEPACRALAQERENAALALRGIPALQAELDSLEREQEKLLAELGGRPGPDRSGPWDQAELSDRADLSVRANPPGLPEPADPLEGAEAGETHRQGWTRAAALLFDCSPAARERVELLRGRLTAAEAEVDACAREKERLERELQRAGLEEARLRQARGSGLRLGPGADPQDSRPAGPNSAFGPEMRQQLEEAGRELERARQAAAECGKTRLLLEREASQLETGLAARQKEIASLARITCREEDLQERRQDLTSLRRLAEQIEAEAADTARLPKQRAGRRAPLFSFTPLRRDPRRAVMALLCLALAALLLQPALAVLASAPASGPGAAQTLGGLLAGNGWAALALGLGCLWATLFWLFPSASLLGLYHPAPDQIQGRLLEGLNRLAGLRQALTRRLERLNAWLPEQLRQAVELPPAEAPTSDTETLLDALPAFYRRVEAFFGTQQDQLLRLQLARLQEGQERERAAALAGQLEEARSAEQRAEADLADCLASWAGRLAPYALGADCAPAAALQIFDRAWRCAELGAALGEAETRLAAGRAALEAARADWTAWLAATPFPPQSGPGAVLDSFALLAKFKELHSGLERGQLKLRALRDDLEVFARSLGELIAGLEESRAEFADLAGGSDSAVRLFDRLASAAQAAARQEALALQRQRDLQALQGRRHEARAALEGCEAALRQLFALAALPGPSSSTGPSGQEEGLDVLAGAEAFRLRFAAYREHRELRLERDRLARQLEQRAGAAAWAEPAEFRQALAMSEPAGLAAREAELREQLELAGQKREAALTRLGEVRAGLAALAEGQGNAALRREQAALREELEQLARRWSVLTLAQAFIQQAKRSFEEERQDLVVRQAGDFFRQMTLERYQGLLFDLEKGRGLRASAVQADLAAGLSLDSEEALSRGTREQLYLALRLAYVRQHNQSREPLPLVMDDILVNFDPARAARCAGILAEFAAQNQVLFFTCHPSMADLLTASAPGAARFSLRNGQIRPA